ncbi:uncharacterized protein LAESUDRAFT_714275 [Laetiporus sulphureus 93-53]|uniref:Uncharacterized protein n=1 Tax=Laetiporus sulphureus 93-53 TaxID=1314785 RepID=A0A165E9Q8_9APHY|nr:uncharacterized protein LAESUDRAFT_714275 [Laetiporus sulphureus 93-53]KZT06545.1 hypothetical protein LAESUDRAFT_714275 [Laetiporus sulphureus 93-53]
MPRMPRNKKRSTVDIEKLPKCCECGRAVARARDHMCFNHLQVIYARYADQPCPTQFVCEDPDGKVMCLRCGFHMALQHHLDKHTLHNCPHVRGKEGVPAIEHPILIAFDLQDTPIEVPKENIIAATTVIINAAPAAIIDGALGAATPAVVIDGAPTTATTATTAHTVDVASADVAPTAIIDGAPTAAAPAVDVTSTAAAPTGAAPAADATDATEDEFAEAPWSPRTPVRVCKRARSCPPAPRKKREWRGVPVTPESPLEGSIFHDVIHWVLPFC